MSAANAQTAYQTGTAQLRGFLAGYKLVSPQPGRRNVWERELERDGLVVCDKIIIVDPGTLEVVRLGDHFHPKGCHEHFQVIAGSAKVYVVPVGSREESGYAHFLTPGDELSVEGLDAHTFICDPGTILSVVTDWKFVEGKSIVRRPVDIDRVPLPIPTHTHL